MLLDGIVSLLAAVGMAFSLYLALAARRAGQLKLLAEPTMFGSIANFFDTLGIGSFAPTLAYFRFRRLVPDKWIPMTMLAGYTPPVFIQSVIFLILLGVAVDPLLIAASAVTITIGAVIGAPIATRSKVRTVQLIVAASLLMAAFFYSLSNLGLMPVGGDAASLPVSLTILAIVASFLFGVLLNFGVGNYAPTLAMLSLMGMDPRLAFPVMATGAALAGAAASSRLVKLADLDLRIVLSLAVGSIPGVLLAAFVVKEMDLELLRWLVVVVVVYAAVTLLYEALRSKPVSREEELARALD